jgi:hypothetical protein
MLPDLLGAAQTVVDYHSNGHARQYAPRRAECNATHSPL